MAATEPDHLGGHLVRPQDLEVRGRFVEREERVGGALDQQGRDADPVDQRPRAARREPLHVLVGELTVRQARRVRAQDVRVEGPGLTRGNPGDRAALDAKREQRRAPSGLRRLGLVEAGDERVPGDVGRDRVEARVDRGRDELDAAAVAGARHADPRVARAVEARLGLLRDVADQRLHVAALSYCGESDCTVPPDWPKPRGSHVRTL